MTCHIGYIVKARCWKDSGATYEDLACASLHAAETLAAEINKLPQCAAIVAAPILAETVEYHLAKFRNDYMQTRYVVDGMEYPDEDSTAAGDGEYPPFRIFDVNTQEYVSGEYSTRAEAEHVMITQCLGAE